MCRFNWTPFRHSGHPDFQTPCWRVRDVAIRVRGVHHHPDHYCVPYPDIWPQVAVEATDSCRYKTFWFSNCVYSSCCTVGSFCGVLSNAELTAIAAAAVVPIACRWLYRLAITLSPVSTIVVFVIIAILFTVSVVDWQPLKSRWYWWRVAV